MKANVVTDLVALGIVASFFVGIAFILSRVYSHALEDGWLKPERSNGGGLRAQLYRGVRSSADGNWKPLLKKSWLGFLLLDLIAIVIVLLA